MSPTWNFFNRSRQSTLKSLIAHSFDLLCLKSNLHMCWHIWVCDSCFCSDQSCDISGTIAFLPSQGVCKSITETTESPECISTLLMSGNQISGELPASLSLLTHLEVLEISSNRYCIYIVSLHTLVFHTACGRLSSTLPSSMSELSSLTTFLANNLALSGTLPEGNSSCSLMYANMTGESTLVVSVSNTFCTWNTSGNVCAPVVLSLARNYMQGRTDTLGCGNNFETLILASNYFRLELFASDYSGGLTASGALFSCDTIQLDDSMRLGQGSATAFCITHHQHRTSHSITVQHTK